MPVSRSIIHQMSFFKDKYPILALTGPRQSGKTTLLRELFPNYTYITLENKDERIFFENDPKGFFEKYSGFCIFDEAQRVPDYFHICKLLLMKKKLWDIIFCQVHKIFF